MADEEEADFLHEYNPMEKNISLNMLDQILEGRDKYISKARADVICSLYDGDKEHLQKFLYKHGLVVQTNELGSAVQDIFDQIFHGLKKGEHDVEIRLTIRVL